MIPDCVVKEFPHNMTCWTEQIQITCVCLNRMMMCNSSLQRAFGSETEYNLTIDCKMWGCVCHNDCVRASGYAQIALTKRVNTFKLIFKVLLAYYITKKKIKNKLFYSSEWVLSRLSWLTCGQCVPYVWVCHMLMLYSCSLIDTSSQRSGNRLNLCLLWNISIKGSCSWNRFSFVSHVHSQTYICVREFDDCTIIIACRK